MDGMKEYKPCYVSYDMNVLDPLGEPIYRNQMCRARRSIFFKHYYVAEFGKVKLQESFPDKNGDPLSYCTAHAEDFLVVQRLLVKKYHYYYGTVNRPFCERFKYAS